jgi:hypothetical protein
VAGVLAGAGVVAGGVTPGVAGCVGAGSVGMLEGGVGGVAGASVFLHAASAINASIDAASRDFFIVFP